MVIIYLSVISYMEELERTCSIGSEVGRGVYVLV